MPAPASVNVLWALSSEATRKSIEKAHQVSAEYALSRVESNMRVVRRNEHGEALEQRKLVRSALEHQTRLGRDPNLRTKAVLQVERLPRNETPTPEQRIDSLAGAVTTRQLYQVQLAVELRQRLGITVELT